MNLHKQRTWQYGILRQATVIGVMKDFGFVEEHNCYQRREQIEKNNESSN